MKRLMIWMPALDILVVAMFAAAGGGGRAEGVVLPLVAPDVHITAPQWNGAHN
jgi:hypothetical protein